MYQKSNLMLGDSHNIYITDDSDDVSSFEVQTMRHVLIKGS
jgi:hypothetical protein